MAGGPIFPRSAVFPSSGKAFPGVFLGATNSKQEEGIGVMASLDADTTVELRFQMPPSLPTGTGKLKLRALANATSGSAKFNPKWKSVAVEESADVATGSLNAETTQTLTWAAGDNDQYKELEIILDADTIVADEEIVMELVFETTSWTLAATSTWIVSIIWE